MHKSEGFAARPNKELKLTKPSVLELRSLTPVFDGPGARFAERTRPSLRTPDQLPLFEGWADPGAHALESARSSCEKPAAHKQEPATHERFHQFDHRTTRLTGQAVVA
jgi:hypothetical protein